MSDYVVHFAPGYDGALAILGSGKIEARSAFGVARRYEWLGESQRCVCLSEIPLDMLGRLVSRPRRSSYGLAFHKDTVLAKGGAPLWYLDKDSAVARAVKQVIDERAANQDASDPIWQATPCIDFPGEYPTGNYRFEWEREWRVPGELRFEPADVAFLFIAEHQHEDAREFFQMAFDEHLGPAYFCPYVDPTWNMEQIQHAVETVPDAPETPRYAPDWDW